MCYRYVTDTISEANFVKNIFIFGLELVSRLDFYIYHAVNLF